ncbi:MAG: hypothetical protein RLP44_30935 [Aggregatilineales bacterium]
MAITVRWADDIDNVILWEFGEVWSWEDFYQMGPQSGVMIASTSERVDTIMISSAKEIPAGAFTQFDKLAKVDIPANHGLIVIVNPVIAAQTMVKISAKMNDVSYWKLADSYDEAKQLIEEDRRQSENKGGDTA